MGTFFDLFTDVAGLWQKYSSQYLSGAWSTIKLAVIATAVGCIIGLACGILQTIPHAKTDNPVKRVLLTVLRAVIRVYVEVFRGTPMILQAVFIYFAVPYFTKNAVRLEMVPAAYLVVSINTGAYMAETVRGGILSIDVGQTEGAKWLFGVVCRSQGHYRRNVQVFPVRRHCHDHLSDHDHRLLRAVAAVGE